MNTIKTLSKSIIFILAISAACFAQGQFLDTGKAGYGFSGGIGKQEGAESFAFDFSASLQSYFDFGLGASRNKSTASRKYTTFFGPSAMLHPLKQKGSIPIGISLGASFNINLLSETNSHRYTIITYSCFAHRKIDINNRISCYPSIGYSLANITKDISDNRTKKYDDSCFLTGIDFRIREASAFALVIGFGASFSDEPTVFALSIGVVIEKIPPKISSDL